MDDVGSLLRLPQSFQVGEKRWSRDVLLRYSMTDFPTITASPSRSFRPRRVWNGSTLAATAKWPWLKSSMSRLSSCHKVKVSRKVRFAVIPRRYLKKN